MTVGTTKHATSQGPVLGQRRSSGATFFVTGPATGEVIAEVAEADQRDLEDAVAAARTASQEWGGSTKEERAEALGEFARRLEANADELASLDVLGVGKLFEEARRDVMGVAAHALDFAQRLSEFDTELAQDGKSAVVWEPFGVVAYIIPWNSPIAAAGRKIAISIATRNGAVIKPSSLAPLSVLKLAELVSPIVPSGLINVVNGTGERVGRDLIACAGVAKLSFTGGTDTGRLVLAEAARRVIPATVELGGKAAQVVLDDAPIDSTAEAVVRGFTRNAGQVCTCGTRLLVHEAIAREFVEAVVQRAGSIAVGDPAEPGTQMGPLISERHRDRVAGYVNRARLMGRPILVGGTTLAGPGFFYPPTIVGDVETGDELFQEEVFGPVLSVTTFRSDEEAATLANASRYGLNAAVWSADTDHALAIALKLDSGAVWLNTFWPSLIGATWEGRGESGFGALDFGSAGLRDFLRPRQVMSGGAMARKQLGGV